MSLTGLVYISRATEFGAMTDEVIEAARLSNRANGVTSLLLSHGGYFVQRLEGDCGTISGLYQKLTEDPRHARITLIVVESLAERSLAGRPLTYVDGGDAVDAAVERFSAAEAFNPYAMTSESLLALTEHLADTGALQPAPSRWRQFLENRRVRSVATR